MEKRREQLQVDPEECTGCGKCEVACAMKHYNREDTGFSRIRILKFDQQELNVPVVCMACNKAPCIKVCPMNARIRQENGTVTTDTDVCIGCRACVYICPVGSPAVNPKNGQTMTCDMCAGDSEEPWCVTACKKEGALALRMIDSSNMTMAAARKNAGRIRSVFPT